MSTHFTAAPTHSTLGKSIKNSQGEGGTWKSGFPVVVEPWKGVWHHVTGCIYPFHLALPSLIIYAESRCTQLLCTESNRTTMPNNKANCSWTNTSGQVSISQPWMQDNSCQQTLCKRALFWRDENHASESSDHCSVINWRTLGPATRKEFAFS